MLKWLTSWKKKRRKKPRAGNTGAVSMCSGPLMPGPGPCTILPPIDDTPSLYDFSPHWPGDSNPVFDDTPSYDPGPDTSSSTDFGGGDFGGGGAGGDY